MGQDVIDDDGSQAVGNHHQLRISECLVLFGTYERVPHHRDDLAGCIVLVDAVMEVGEDVTEEQPGPLRGLWTDRLD